MPPRSTICTTKAPWRIACGLNSSAWRYAAERQWNVNIGKSWYKLDFALFCENGKIDVETDGDTWHAARERIAEDNRRDNDMESTGWHVLRFNGHQIREEMSSYSVPKVTQMITRLGGLSEEGLVGRSFYDTPDGMAQQLTLLEDSPEYANETEAEP